MVENSARDDYARLRPPNTHATNGGSFVSTATVDTFVEDNGVGNGATVTRRMTKEAGGSQDAAGGSNGLELEQNPLNDVPAAAVVASSSSGDVGCCRCCDVSGPTGRKWCCSRSLGLTAVLLALTVIMVAFFSLTAAPGNGPRWVHV